MNGPAKRKYISVSYSQKLTQEIEILEKESLKLYHQKPDADVAFLTQVKNDCETMIILETMLIKFLTISKKPIIFQPGEV